MKHFVTTLTLVLLLLTTGFSQTYVGGIFLLNPSSATLNGMGEIGVALPYDQPDAAYFNPANGIYGVRGISVLGTSHQTHWLPGLADDMSLDYKFLGVSLIPGNGPFQLVAHYQNTLLDAGTQYYHDSHGITTGPTSNWYSSKAYTLAGRYTFRTRPVVWDVSVGISRKQAIMHLIDEKFARPEWSGEARNIFYDGGVLVSAKWKQALKSGVVLSFQPGAGYSLMNVGDNIVFKSESQKDPSPRIARAGISFSGEVLTASGNPLFSVRWGHAAADILANPRFLHSDPITYQSGLGDIQIINHILLSKGSDLVETTRGQSLTLFDFITYRDGMRNTPDMESIIHESGYGFNSRGLIQLLTRVTSHPILAAINHHLTLRYDHSEWSDSGTPVNHTNFEAISLTLHNLDPASWKRGADDRFGSPKIALDLVNGLSYSRLYRADFETDGPQEPQVERGYQVGVETPIHGWIAGLSFSQIAASFLEVDSLGWFTLRFRVKDQYQYVTLYGLRHYSPWERLTLLAGPRLSYCTGRKISIWGKETYVEKNHDFNAGITGGVQVRVTQAASVRLSYDYWLRNLRTEFESVESLRLGSFQINLVVGI